MTFGIIVLNGEPFVRYNLRALYPFAHQIIVAEGAAPAAANIAGPDGHSRDGTLEVLRRFQAEEDPEHKVLLVTAEDEGHPDGFWPGEKHEQSQAYARRATGDWLWQVDIDEFYQPADLQRVLAELVRRPELTAVSFPMLTFWGGFDYLTDGWPLRRGARLYHRLFRWGPGYRYTTHRPPTVVDETGRDLRERHWWRGEEVEAAGIVMYHYSLLFPHQVLEKSNYYSRAGITWMTEYDRWAQENYLRLGNPWRVHNLYHEPSWLERFRGTHPPQIAALRADLAAGRVTTPSRDCADVERWLGTWRARLGPGWLKFLDWWDRSWNSWQGLPQHPLVWALALGPRVVRKVFGRRSGGLQPGPKAP